MTPTEAPNNGPTSLPDNQGIKGIVSRNPKFFFMESLNRCIEKKDFFDLFYKKFMGSSEEIAAKFSKTNFKKQHVMLLRSLRLAADATEGIPSGLRELKERALTHNRDHLDIKPELYTLWLEAIIEAARKCDRDWDSDIEYAWRKTLGFVIEYMTARH